MAKRAWSGLSDGNSSLILVWGAFFSFSVVDSVLCRFFWLQVAFQQFLAESFQVQNLSGRERAFLSSRCREAPEVVAMTGLILVIYSTPSWWLLQGEVALGRLGPQASSHADGRPQRRVGGGSQRR